MIIRRRWQNPPTQHKILSKPILFSFLPFHLLCIFLAASNQQNRLSKKTIHPSAYLTISQPSLGSLPKQQLVLG